MALYVEVKKPRQCWRLLPAFCVTSDEEQEEQYADSGGEGYGPEKCGEERKEGGISSSLNVCLLWALTLRTEYQLIVLLSV